MRVHPVEVDVSSPGHFDRIQLLLRLGIAIVLGWIGITAGWLVCMLYATLPLIAAVAISSMGTRGYVDDFAPRTWRVVAWLLQLSAYMTLLVDRFPMGEDSAVQPRIRITGRPTVSSALLRLLTSIPSGLVLGILWFVSAILWFVALVFVVLGAAIPRPILGYQRGVLRWQARLVAYHASLVEEYPPFTLDTGDGHAGTLHAVAP
jgi:hypothetical protein